MIARAAPTARRAGTVPAAVPAAIAVAWTVALVADATGAGAWLHHDALVHSALPLWAALALFLVAWQVMVAAMMVPSSLPMIRLFTATSASQDRPRVVQAAFLGGYAAVWSAFGAAAFVGDAGLHRAAHVWPWLGQRPWLIAGGVLALAGAFQFSSLKEKCLTECRHPAAFLLQHYRRGAGEAFRLGQRHGLFCLGCCWALMLLMFAAGVASLWWMAALGALMAYEKIGRHGQAVGRVAGVVLLTTGAFVLAHPAWIPPVLGG